MKKIIFVSSLLISTYFFQSCSGGTNTKDSVDSANQMNAQKDTTASAMKADSSSAMSTMPVDKADADFAVKAANGGMMEVKLGALAQQNGSSQRVKDFGAMMVKDHTAVNDKLKALANAKNITLPNAISNDGQKEVDKLGKKSGKDFDKSYMNMMLSDHKDDISDFQKAGANCKDTDLKNFALQTLPTLQVHLDSAIAITGKK